MKRLTALVISLSMVGASAEASTNNFGYITDIHSIGGGAILFIQSGTRTSTPACATVGGRWAFDGTTAAGQAKLAILLTAYAQHKPLFVLGTDNCDVWGDTESVSYFATQD